MNSFQQVTAASTILIVGVFVVSSVFGTMPAMAMGSVANEQVNADVGNWTQVDETYGEHYYENETVQNSSGANLTEGTDYEWSPSNQSVKFYNTASVSDNETMTISYWFDAKPEAARSSIGTIASAFSLGAVAVIVVVAALILNLIGGFGGGGGGRRGGGRRR